MIKWFRPKIKEDPRTIADIPEVNLAEWVDSGQAAELGKLLRSPTIRLALRVVAESIPIPMPTAGSPPTDIIFASGVTAGYALCLDNLRKLSQTLPYSDAEAKFETPRE